MHLDFGTDLFFSSSERAINRLALIPNDEFLFHIIMNKLHIFFSSKPIISKYILKFNLRSDTA